MQGPLTRRAFFSLSLWIQCSLFSSQMCLKNPSEHLFLCLLPLPISFLLRSQMFSLNWTWGPQLTTSPIGLGFFPQTTLPPRDPTIPQSSRPWRHPPCLLPNQGPLVPKPRLSFLSPCQSNPRPHPLPLNGKVAPPMAPIQLEATADWRRPDKGNQSADTS